MIQIDEITLHRPAAERRFWLGVAALALLLTVASVVIVLQGSRAGLRARALQPAPESIASVRPAIRLTFTRPVARESVEGAVTIAPPVPFDLSWAENELRILPRTALQAETTYTVTVGPGVRDAAGSPLVGEIGWRFHTRQPRLAYLRPASEEAAELWLTDVQGGPGERLSAPGQAVQDLTVAPDGSAIVYSAIEGPNTANLWRVEPGQRGWTKLTDLTGTVFNAPRFGPTGDLLAVEVREEVKLGEQGQPLAPPRLELRRPIDGSPAGEIYGGQGAVAHTPRWSPDGTRLAFFEANRGAVGLYNFTPAPRFFPAESANLGAQAWAPDGRALAYTLVRLSGEQAQQILVIRDLDAGTEHTFVETVGNISDPAWSPDGRTIAYAYQPPPGMERGGEIWLMAPDGSAREPLVAQEGLIFTQPLWSPDGAWLVLSRFDLANPQAPTELWAVRRDGSDLRRVAGAGFLSSWVP